jgi:hypothetical protein
MANDLKHVHAKLAWAKAQLPILGAETQFFIDSKPYRIWKEVNEERGGFDYKIKYTQPVPDSILISASNLAHQIRSSLDQMAATLAVRNGATNTKDVHFPISHDRDSFFDGKRAGVKKIARLSAVDRQIIIDLKPYFGGNDLLYALHQMSITDKHNRPLRAAGFTASVAVDEMIGDLMIGPDIGTWSALDDERTVLWTTSPYLKAYVTTHVCIEEIGQRPGIALAPMFGEFIGAVKSIVALFD